jgi:uncharacterized membrane protein
VPVALAGAMAIMLASLYLAHGPGRMTTAAVVGTALALGLTAALSAAFVAAAALTGLASEDALNASFTVGGLSLRGLLLAGIILGGLGVLDDVTVSRPRWYSSCAGPIPPPASASWPGARWRSAATTSPPP